MIGVCHDGALCGTPHGSRAGDSRAATLDRLGSRGTHHKDLGFAASLTSSSSAISHHAHLDATDLLHPTTMRSGHTTQQSESQESTSRKLRTSSAKRMSEINGTRLQKHVATLSAPIATKLSTHKPELPDNWAEAIVARPEFRHGINAVIIIGAIQLGLEASFKDGDWKLGYKIWDNFYTTLSVVETLLMIRALKLVYFLSPWLLLDFLLAIAAILDVWIFPIVNGGENTSSTLRSFRLLRVLRVIKMARVLPGGLGLLLEGLLSSFRSMFWIVMLLALILYGASVLCVNVLGSEDSGFPAYTHDETEIRHILLADWNNYIYFGTIFRSMITLMNVVLLTEWNVIRKVSEEHKAMVPFFLILTGLCTFGILNVIIGVVVEKTTYAMSQPRLEEVQKERQQKISIVEQLARVLYSIDSDNDGNLSVTELEQALNNEDFLSMLAKLDLPHGYTTVEFLSTLDMDGSGHLSEHEFITGLSRLIFCNEWQRDCMRSMSVGMIQHAIMNVGLDLQAEIQRSIMELRAEIQSALGDIHWSAEAGASSTCVNYAGPKTLRARSLASQDSHHQKSPTSHDHHHFAQSEWEPMPPSPVNTVRGVRNGQRQDVLRDTGAHRHRSPDYAAGNSHPHSRSPDYAAGNSHPHSGPHQTWTPAGEKVIGIVVENRHIAGLELRMLAGEALLSINNSTQSCDANHESKSLPPENGKNQFFNVKQKLEDQPLPEQLSVHFEHGAAAVNSENGSTHMSERNVFGRIG